MPIDYWSIIKRAFRITIHYPKLWLLGLFLAGGFNVNFFYWANLRLPWRNNSGSVLGWIQQNIQASPHAIIATVIIIILSAVIVIAVNWAKIMFILYNSDLLKLQRLRSQPPLQQPSFALSWRETPGHLFPVIAMSIFTMVSMTLVVSVLGGGARLLFASRGGVWLVAGLIFIGLVFFFSCLNIFGTFFMVFYRRSFSSAVNLALDLITSRWRPIAEMAFLLMVIYALGFFVGTFLLFVFTLIVTNLLTPLTQVGLLPWPLVLSLTTLLGGLLLWAWLSVINTFFNVSLLLLFVELVRPLQHPELENLSAELPATAPAPASPG